MVNCTKCGRLINQNLTHILWAGKDICHPCWVKLSHGKQVMEELAPPLTELQERERYWNELC